MAASTFSWSGVSLGEDSYAWCFSGNSFSRKGKRFGSRAVKRAIIISAEKTINIPIIDIISAFVAKILSRLMVRLFMIFPSILSDNFYKNTPVSG
jgi:hypothetical protein